MSTFEQHLTSPEEAQDLLNSIAHPRQKRLQRPLSKDHMSKLTKQIKVGRFKDVSPIHFVFCEEDQSTYLVNGQHTLNSIVQAKTPVTLTIRKDTCPTFNEVALLYMATDHSKVRRPQDTHRAFNLHEELGLSLTEMDYISAAIKFISYNFNHNGGHVDDLSMGKAIAIYAEPFKLFKECSARGESKIVSRLYNRGYLSIALLTFKFAPEPAKEFWKMVCHGERNGSRFRPEAVLNEKIKEYVTTGGWKVKQARSVAPGALSKIASATWNAYIEGREIKSFRVPEQVTLKGIPITEAQEEIRLSLEMDSEPASPVTDFAKIEFYPQHHIYKYENSTPLTSVTKFISTLHPPFNRQGLAEKKARELGVTPQQVMDNWTEAGRRGKELGTTVHDYIQQKLNGLAIDELRYYLNGNTPLEFDAFDKYYDRIRQKGIRPIWIEQIIGDIEYKLAGTVDCLFLHPQDGYILVDWKTGKMEEWNTQKFNPPFEKIPCDDRYKYSFQLSLYKLIAERNTDIKISKMYIVHLFGDEYKIIPAIDYGLDLDGYLKSR